MIGSTPKKPKKPYAAPRLIRHGKFRDIVQGVGGTRSEAGPRKSKI